MRWYVESGSRLDAPDRVAVVIHYADYRRARRGLSCFLNDQALSDSVAVRPYIARHRFIYDNDPRISTVIAFLDCTTVKNSHAQRAKIVRAGRDIEGPVGPHHNRIGTRQIDAQTETSIEGRERGHGHAL